MAPHSSTVRARCVVFLRIQNVNLCHCCVHNQLLTVNLYRPVVWFFNVGHKIRVLIEDVEQRGRATFGHSRQEYRREAVECHLATRGTDAVPDFATRGRRL